jgi:hypothetical protein
MFEGENCALLHRHTVILLILENIVSQKLHVFRLFERIFETIRTREGLKIRIQSKVGIQ